MNKDLNKDIKHGTRNSYMKHKCRCNLCVEAKRIYEKEYWNKNRDRENLKDREHRFNNPNKYRERGWRLQGIKKEGDNVKWEDFKDNIQLMESAIAYLKQFGKT